MSRVPRGTDIAAAELGASMLGLSLFDQGRRVASVLEARRGDGVLYPDVLVEIARRATKTTSIWATLVGRAVTRPGYRCVVTAQSGNMASRILLEHATLLVANGYARYSQEKADDPDLAVVFRNGGREYIAWPNGSKIWAVPPDAGAVRSAAADDVVVDEAGELDPVKGQDFIDAVRPLQDTRGPLAQFIMAGTPGRSRSGPFWSRLAAAREGAGRGTGIVDYAIRDDEDPEDRKVWRRVHPGPSSKLPNGRALTPMSTLEKRRAEMDLVSFSREYLCLWPTDAETGALDVEAFKAGVVSFPDERPTRSVLAFHAPKESSCAAVMEVWRDEDGMACIEVRAFRPGTSWVPRFVHHAARVAKAPVVIDEIGGNVTLAAELRRLRPAVNVVPLNLRQVGGAAQLLANEVRGGHVRHFDQPDLTAAVEGAGWRPAGRDSRAFGRRPGKGEVVPVVAASMALWHYDTLPARRKTRIVTAG
jgi:hypothetical protein